MVHRTSETVLIATWNVNSIRTRLEQVKTWLLEIQPDLLCLQETKVEDALFPFNQFEEIGYKAYFHGQKSYNGVAMITPHRLEDVRSGFSGELLYNDQAKLLGEQKRIISALLKGIRFVNLYVPNGSSIDSDKYEYKLHWLELLNTYIDCPTKRNEPICLLGDFNIALEGIDIHNPKRLEGGIMASTRERDALKRILNKKFQDVFRLFESETNHWTWWDYRSGAWNRDKGWRIDHIYCSEELTNQAKSCFIDKKVRGNNQPSDHAPVVVEINWPPDESMINDDLFL